MRRETVPSMTSPRRATEFPEDRRRMLSHLQETTSTRRVRPATIESQERGRSPEVIMIEAFARLADAREQSKDSPLRPSVELITDGSSIENHQIDIVDATDDKKRPRREVMFKIREPLYHHVSSYLELRAKIGEVQPGFIEYHGRVDDTKATLSEAWVFEHQGLTVRVAKGMVDVGSRDKRQRVPVRTALGAVRIELTGAWLKKTPAEIGVAIHELLETRLGVVGGLRDPGPEDVEAYKQARYAWHHKLPPLRPWEKRQLPELTRAEVYPGYHTMVQEGRHKEYLAMGDFAIYHEHVGGPEGLLRMIRHGGLSSTDERWRRGLVSMNSLSTLEDLREGGAASFFTRCITTRGVRRNEQLLQEQKEELKEKFNPLFHHHLMDAELSSDALVLIMEHDVMDRTDFYAYEHDRFGSTKPEIFRERQSPKELFDMQALAGFNPYNEQMFRTGIRLQGVKAIACTPELRLKTIAFLRKNGVTEVNGKSLEEFLVAAKKRSDFIDVAMGRKPKGMAEIPEEAQQNASEPRRGSLKRWLTNLFG